MITKEKIQKIKETINDRRSNKTIGEKWLKIREYSSYAWGVSGSALAVIGTLTLGVPGWIVTTLTVVNAASGFLAGRAQLDTSGKKK